VRKPFASAEAASIRRDPSIPVMSCYLDKEIGWITHEERAKFEDALFSQPVGRCCQGKLQTERDALQKLIDDTQLNLRNRIPPQNDGSDTQRSTASSASAVASAAADKAAEEDGGEVDDDVGLIAILPSYEISKSGVIKWTFMDKLGGDLANLKPIRKHDKPDDLKSYLPLRWSCR
jgi:hypothetical protein